MRRLWYVILLLIVSLLAFSNVGAQSTENLIAPYETGDKYFERFEIGDWIVYFHQRTLGGAIVEKDFINYRFDKETQQLLEKRENWRKDLPEVLPPAMLPVISAAQAAAMVPGEALFARLYIISPNSDVFPIKPTPANPCWIVRSVVNGQQVVFIIDAVTGQDLGRGIAPPYDAFSLDGPDWGNKCDPYWPAWAQSARDWYNTMGYSTNYVDCPTDAVVQSNIQNSQIVLFYELAHGGSTAFHNHCPDTDNITPTQIKTWIGSGRKFSFAFIGSCEGLCDTGSGTFSYEFRKGSSDSTVVVGYCGMSEAYCDTCWGHSIDWQNMLFYYMYYGYTIKQAFDLANAAYPTCAGTNNCMRFTGDTYFRLRKRAELMGAGGVWGGIWYHNFAQQLWYNPYTITPNITGVPIAVGDVNGDGKADMVSSWTSGLWWQNGATWGWNKVYSISPLKLACADITGDGKAEIIGAGGWNGIWYLNPATNGWTQMYPSNPDYGIGAGDINGDGHADVASSWASGLWYQNGANLAWTKVYNLPPQKVAVGDVTGDGKAEIIATGGWNGIWYWNPATNGWTQMYTKVPSGAIAAGDVTGDGRADVVSIWADGVWYQDGRTLGWTHFYSSAPASIAVGNISGN